MASSSSPSNFVSGFNSLAADPPASLPVDSDLVVILAALLCALICCVGLFSAVRCACLRRAASVSTNSHSMLQVLSHDKGLKKKVLEALPKSTFTNNKNNNNSCSSGVISGTSSTTVNVDDGNLADCAICLTEFVEGDELRILPQCGHGFHVGCIDMWLGSHSSCPSCRQNLGVSGCKKCGELPAKSTGDIDLELGGFKSAAAATTTTTTTTTNQDDDDDNRFLA